MFMGDFKFITMTINSYLFPLKTLTLLMHNEGGLEFISTFFNDYPLISLSEVFH